MQACSDLAHVVLVLVRRVTVVIVHIGLEGVLVVVHFCVAILFVNCCIRRCSLYTFCVGLFRGAALTRQSGDANSRSSTPLFCFVLNGPKDEGDVALPASWREPVRGPSLM